jgi:ribosome biogenesis protein Tsr3
LIAKYGTKRFVYCANWTRKDAAFCVKCFWARPENYEHIAGKRRRIISILFAGDEIEDYERLIGPSRIERAQEAVKTIIHEYLK